MGPINSKTFVDISNEISANVIMRNMQNCSGGIEQTQNMVVSGWSFFSTQKQDASVNLTCASNFKMDSNIANQIASEITQKAQAEGVALLSIGGVSAEAETRIRNAVSTNITSELVQNTIAKIKQEQNLLVNMPGINVGSFQQQSAAVVQKALAEAINRTNFSAEINSMITQDSRATSKNPLSFLGDMWKWFVILIMVIIVVIIGGIFYVLGS